MRKALRQIVVTGIKTEPPPAADETVRVASRLQDAILNQLGRALTTCHADAGSCNGCELEIHAGSCNGCYNLEGLDIKFVARPRHAGMLLVTGPVSKHMEQALRGTNGATPDPKLVVAVGECGCNGGGVWRELCKLRPRDRPRRAERGIGMALTQPDCGVRLTVCRRRLRFHHS